MFKKSFCFGGIVSPDKIHVSAEDFFSPEKGWGFLRQEDIKFDEFGEESLLGGGFSSRTDNDAKEDGKIIDTKFGARLEKENFPIRFKISVPENGNYRIKIKFFGGETGVENLSVWAMRRSLAANGIEISSGSEFSMSFCVNVSPYKPFASNKTVDEKAVYISVLGNPAVLGEIEIESANVPTIFVAGDSTLTDQNVRFPYFPAESCGGWAQMLTAFINDGAAVCNQAHSGMTGTCFFEDGHWDIVFSQMKKGDLLLVQFGHNDQKRRYLRPFGGYLQNLLKYIELSRQKGAFPIIVTPISRNLRDSGGKLTDSLLDYANACIKAGEITGVPVLDLHARTFEFLQKSYSSIERYLLDSLTDHLLEDDVIIPIVFAGREAFSNGSAFLGGISASGRFSTYTIIFFLLESQRRSTSRIRADVPFSTRDKFAAYWPVFSANTGNDCRALALLKTFSLFWPLPKSASSQILFLISPP